MGRWTEQGEQLVQDVANRYGASHDAVSAMLESILRGNGTMAQFNIPELGGSGQWMRGGMTMVGDMFNYQLKSKVDNICSELSSAIVDKGLQVAPAVSTQSGGGLSQGGNSWWPTELGSPNSSGSQNQYRYAYFSNARRLAISDGQNVTVYDTLDHRIGGVSQQQGSNTGVCFSSQYGTVDLRTLPLVSGPALGASVAPPSHSFSPPGSNSSEDLLAIIERLAKLRDAGALTDEEFQAKKTDLLSRL
ncbi:MAG: SHOCT domain-containing protein [Planctomycetaceae bacterium]